jgi:mercuric ion transport protein
MPEPVPPKHPERSGPGGALALLGALLAVACCAGPALIASGALAGLAAWISSPWAITGAVALLAAAVAVVLRRRSRGRAASCCPPPADERRPPAPSARSAAGPGRGHRGRVR